MDSKCVVVSRSAAELPRGDCLRRSKHLGQREVDSIGGQEHRHASHGYALPQGVAIGKLKHIG